MILSGNKLFFEPGQVSTVHTIPVGNWLVRFDEIKSIYYLDKMEDFTLPDKIYGSVEKLTDRYLNTYKKYDKNLGIALTGLKGTGKSLLAKNIARASEMPVLIIDEPHGGSTFNAFLNGIQQKCVVFIDEFEKTYEDRVLQQQLLSVLDGVFMGTKLFIFTSNETSKFSNHLLNRPGRIHYMKDFQRIDDETVEDIIENCLNNKDYKEKLVEIINLIDDANVDMVISLIREMNDYKEPANEAIKYLNISLTAFSNFNLEIFEDGYKYIAQTDRNPLVMGELNTWTSLDVKDAKRKGIPEDTIQKHIETFGDEKHFNFSMEDFIIDKMNSNGKTVLIHKEDPTTRINIARRSEYSHVF